MSPQLAPRVDPAERAESARRSGGVCSGCPYRAHCHPARQLAVEQRKLGLGRHYLCQFYQELHARIPVPCVPRPPRRGVWARLRSLLGG